MRAILALVGLLLLLAPGAARAEPPKIIDAERAKIEAVVRDYLMAHPEVILQSVEAYRGRREAEEQKAAEAAVVANRDVLLNDKNSPAAGNPKGDVTVVEFFDYQCGYCKKMLPTMQELLRTDPNLRWVFKEYPVLGPASQRAAQAAQAVWAIAPDKYLAFHVAMMEGHGQIDDARLAAAAKAVGVDPDQMMKTMADPAIKQRLAANMKLGKELRINGTPAFIVGDRLVPGAMDIDSMRETIADARAASR